MSDKRLTVQVWNELPELRRLAETVDAFCDEQHIPEMVAFQINLALDEILTNVISYGYSDNNRHHIGVDFLCQDGDLTIEIVDDGRPFDPFSAPAPDLDAPLEERRPGGLGIHLVKTVMDGVEYQRKSGRNHLTLRKRIRASTPDS